MESSSYLELISIPEKKKAQHFSYITILTREKQQ